MKVNNEEYEDLQRLCTSMCNSHNVNDFIHRDKNVYMNNNDINVLIYDQSTNQSYSENGDNEEYNEVNYKKNQLKTFRNHLFTLRIWNNFQ